VKLWKCTACGKIGLWNKRWGYYSSILLDEEYPSLRIVCCSKKCMDEADQKLASGEWALPKIRNRGYTCKMSRPHKGYEPQPEQDTLKAEYEERLVALENPS
jgi:hypothetical protein